MGVAMALLEGKEYDLQNAHRSTAVWLITSLR